tara:strand:+ start:237 stop:641 length:405 start_codon:yes stop_codon:yes gene_type:complete
MQIKLMGYDLQEAIALYIKSKYNAQIDVDPECFMHVFVQEHKPKYLLDAEDERGGFKRDDKGHAIVDDSQEQYFDHCLPFCEWDGITFHAKEVKNAAPDVDERGNYIEPCGCIEAKVLSEGHYCDTVLNGTGAE